MRHNTCHGVCSLCSPERLLDCACCGVGLLQALEELKGGKKTHSVFDSEAPRPMCISNPNLAKWGKMSSIPRCKSSLVLNGKAPSSTYKHCSISYAVSFLDLNIAGVWLQIFPSAKCSLAVVITQSIGMSHSFRTIPRVSVNAVIRNRKSTGAMLSPCRTPTV